MAPQCFYMRANACSKSAMRSSASSSPALNLTSSGVIPVSSFTSSGTTPDKWGLSPFVRSKKRRPPFLAVAHIISDVFSLVYLAACLAVRFFLAGCIATQTHDALASKTTKAIAIEVSPVAGMAVAVAFSSESSEVVLETEEFETSEGSFEISVFALRV